MDGVIGLAGGSVHDGSPAEECRGGSGGLMATSRNVTGDTRSVGDSSRRKRNDFHILSRNRKLEKVGCVAIEMLWKVNHVRFDWDVAGENGGLMMSVGC